MRIISILCIVYCAVCLAAVYGLWRGAPVYDPKAWFFGAVATLAFLAMRIIWRGGK